MTVGYLFIMLWLHIGLTSFYPAASSLQSFRFAGSSLVNGFFSGASPPLPRPLKTKKTPLRRFFVFMVGMTGFEPATPCTPCKCATRLRYIPTTKKFIKLSERKCKFFFSKMKNKFSINYGNVKNPGMRMQTGVKLKKAKF